MGKDGRTLFGEDKDATGQTFMDSLLMTLENGHMLSCNIRDIPVSNYNSSPTMLNHATYLFECISIQVVHGVGFFDADRLAVREIRYHCIEGLTEKRKTCCICKQEI